MTATESQLMIKIVRAQRAQAFRQMARRLLNISRQDFVAIHLKPVFIGLPKIEQILRPLNADFKCYLILLKFTTLFEMCKLKLINWHELYHPVILI